YPSIPHLPGSRAAEDRVLPAVQARRFIDPTCVRPGETVIVEEKLDGSCVLVAREGEQVVAFGREGGRADASLNEGRRMFAAWVAKNAERFTTILSPGDRAAGEWMALVPAIRYALPHEPFVLFDVFCNDRRLGRAEVR